MDKQGFSLIEILVAVVVIGIGFGIILLTTSNVEQSAINNSRDIKGYFLADNTLNRYILEKAYGINLNNTDDEESGFDFEQDKNDTFYDKLALYSVSFKKESFSGDDFEITVKRYAISNE